MSQIVVTGAAGFIGSRVVRRLLAEQQQIVAVDAPPLFGSRACARDFAHEVEKVGIADLLTWLKSAQPAAVIHMGASSSTDETREDYLKQVNTDYTRALWDICTEKKLPFVYASSGATYGAGDCGFSDDPSLIPALKPLNLYGWSKQNFDVQALQATSSPPVWAGLKYFNVYGKGEDHKGAQASVIFHFRNQVVANKKIKLFKSHRVDVRDGEQKRDFVFVDDVVEATLAFAGGSLKNGIYNIGTGLARTYLDVAHAVFKALGVPPQIEFVDTPAQYREHYQYFTQAELKNLRAAGFQRPFTSLEDGIKSYLKDWESA